VAHYGEAFTFAVSVELHVTTAEQVLIKTYIEDLYWNLCILCSIG